MATRMPIFRLSEAALEIMPTTVGPAEQPRSPPSASMQNSAVPPRRSDAEAMEKVPGQKMPTEKPQIPQPIRPSAGQGLSEVIR